MDVDPIEQSPDDDVSIIELLHQRGYRYIRHMRLPKTGYGHASNLGASSGSAPVIAIFNADVQLNGGQLVRLAQLAARRKAIVGPRQVDKSGRLRHCGAWNPEHGSFTYRAFGALDTGQFTAIQIMDRISGSAMFIPRGVWDDLTDCSLNPSKNGALLETPLYFEDTWLCAHAKQHGYDVVYDGTTTIQHEWRSAINAEMERGEITFQKDHERLLEAARMFDNACRRSGLMPEGLR